MKLTKENITDYLNIALNSDAIKELSKNSRSEFDVRNIIKDLFTFITTYITSTSDLSIESLESISNKTYEHFDDLVADMSNHNNAKMIFFNNYIFPMIYKFYTGKDYTINTSIRETLEVANKIKMSSCNNQFETHSFPGALEEKISKEGLNIHSEMFPLELKYLEHFGFKSPYKTGVLCLTELSDMSVAYAMDCPERIKMSFSGLCPELKKKMDETEYMYNLRIIEEFNNKNIGISGIEQAISYLNKINDFYFKENSCCIAVIDNNKEQVNVSEIEIPYSQIIHSIKSNFKDLRLQDEYLNNYLNQVEMLLKEKNQNSIDLLDLVRQYLSTKYPNKEEVIKFSIDLNNILMKKITTSALNNFYRAYGDGYKVDSGIIERERISVVSFTNPYYFFSKSRNGEQFGTL